MGGMKKDGKVMFNDLLVEWKKLRVIKAFSVLVGRNGNPPSIQLSDATAELTHGGLHVKKRKDADIDKSLGISLAKGVVSVV